MAPPPAWLGEPVIADPGELVRAFGRLGADRRLLVYAQPSRKPGRVGGLPPEILTTLHEAGRFTATLVKAAGMRSRSWDVAVG